MKIYDKIKENLYFILFLCGITIYYIWRLFNITPWYDELFTYRNFIDRGIIYSMTHWPLPNNHIFFSICSAILNKYTNPYIGLRGISLLASIGSFILLYRLIGRIMNKMVALAGCNILASMYCVTRQAVQGRGYALSGFLLLLALTELFNICVTDKDKGNDNAGRHLAVLSHYICFALSLAGGLYTVPSNLYWVIPICLAGGVFLLFMKDYKKLCQLIAVSLCAAVLTFGLYSIIWCFTGASMLRGDAANGFSGMRIRQIVIKTPLKCMSLGLNNMLSNGFIQSISKEEFWNGLYAYISSLLNSFYQGKASFIKWLLFFCLEVVMIEIIKHIKAEKFSLVFLELYCVILICAIPIGLWMQTVLPFTRIYTYLGNVLTLLFSLVYYAVAPRRVDKIYVAMAIALLLVCCSEVNYNSDYSDKDTEIKMALESMDMQQVNTTLENDEYVSLNQYFYINKLKGKNLESSYDQPDFVLVDNILGNKENGLKLSVWPYYRTTEELPWEWIEEHMEKIYVGSTYTAYQVKR